ncbi:MAG: peptide chain release factor N(5)-glutamine methyltransferase [Francisellaceae bacterium]|nr:peptide chain release factor N(5)-glutamine methyltransferase [Francisellaceae bacterium]
MHSIDDILNLATQRLNENSASPRLDAELLLSHALGENRIYLKTHNKNTVVSDDLKYFNQLIERRATGYPIAYIFNRKSFWDFELYVDESVLIPRPETELLVEKALELIPKTIESNILELGVGSGAVSIAIAKERPLARVIATDLSILALNVARNNAIELGVENIFFCNASWFQCLKSEFDFIISNPPYLHSDDPHFVTDSLEFEPRLALDAGVSGLSCYEQIINEATKFLKPRGVILLEHGCEQANALETILQTSGFVGVNTSKDLSGHDRVISARNS